MRASSPAPLIRRLGQADYVGTWHAMQAFTQDRSADTPDEIWLLEHPPIYTYGVAGRAQHLPADGSGIPLVKVDRGGQVTYHGPGQVIAYTLVDLHRLRMTVRGLVERLEQAVLDLLAQHGVAGARRCDAPGVYVDGAKVAALGLRIRNGRAYHGLSLNVDVDLRPFEAIDPCGYPELKVTRTADLGIGASAQRLGEELADRLIRQFERA
jgi:lipoyl(octanoyl) transferase